MLISPAYAQATGSPMSGLEQWGSILPLILIFVVFYFLLIRPQQKKMKEHKAKIAGIKRGDRIVTGGGVVGTVTRDLGPDECQVEIAEGVRVRIVKSTVADIRAKSEPVSSSRADDEDDDEEAKERSSQAKR